MTFCSLLLSDPPTNCINEARVSNADRVIRSNLALSNIISERYIKGVNFLVFLILGSKYPYSLFINFAQPRQLHPGC